jgi:xylulokinase
LKRDCILGLDLGTQSIKGVIVSRDGTVVASADLSRPPQHPRPGWAEMDAERDWWQASIIVIKQLLTQLPERFHLAGMGICGLVPCLQLLDNLGKPLHPAILYADNRALEELAWVNAQAGLQLNAQAVVPKLLWLQRNKPEILEKAHALLSAHNYIVYRLTGIACMDFDTASIMGGIFDPSGLAWDERLIQDLGLPRHIWPELKATTGIAGQVTPQAASFSGLPVGLPVIVGSGDTFPTMVGCGAIFPGDAMVSIGTTGLLTLTDQELVKAAAGPHFIDQLGQGVVTWGANVLSAGRLVTWFMSTFRSPAQAQTFTSISEVLNDYESLAAAIPAGSDGLVVLPHLLGRRTPTPDAKMRGAILGLTTNHTSAHIYRAILESFAYNIRQGLDPLRSRILRLIATAGGAHSLLWRQILADVLEMPIQFTPKSSGALGMTFLAAYALTWVDDFNEIATLWLQDLHTIVPDEKSISIYRQYFAVYCAFDQAVTPPFAALQDASFNDLQSPTTNNNAQINLNRT